MHPWVLRAPVDEVAKPLSILFEKSWQSGEVGSWWIRNWLDGHSPRAVVSSSMSKWKPVVSGAPQGSVWGLMLSDPSVSDRDRGWSAP